VSLRALAAISLVSAACGDGRVVPLVPITEADASVSPDVSVSPDAAAIADDASSSPDAAGLDASTPDTGYAPIVTTEETWTWVDFPTSACDDGTPTGIGLNATSRSSNVILFLNGGGACWDYTTCVELNTSAHGPFGAVQFATIRAALNGGGSPSIPAPRARAA